MNILIRPVQTWEAWCDCGWSDASLDRSEAIKAAREHRREDHAGQCDIRSEFAKGTADFGAIIAPATRRGGATS